MGQRQQRSRTRSRSGPRNDQRQVVKQPFVIVSYVLTILGQGRRGQAAAQVGQFVAAAQGHVGNAIGRDPVQEASKGAVQAGVEVFLFLPHYHLCPHIWDYADELNSTTMLDDGYDYASEYYFQVSDSVLSSEEKKVYLGIQKVRQISFCQNIAILIDLDFLP